MALVLVAEDGTGKTNSNSYVTTAECDSYHEGHLYATKWTTASGTQKTAACVMATRVIDQTYQFNGFKRTSTQALQWPRYRAVNPDSDETMRGGAYFDPASGNYFDETKIPQILKDAVCEMARELLTGDRTVDPDGMGLKVVDIYEAVKVEFDKSNPRRPVSSFVETILSKLGTLIGGGGSVKLERS